MEMTKKIIETSPIDVSDRIVKYLRQWAYDCAWWQRNAVAEFGTRSEKVRAARRMTEIQLGIK